MKKKDKDTIPCVVVMYGIIILSMFTCSCSEISTKNSRHEIKGSNKKHLIIQKPGSSFSDTVIINTKSAVFYNPDSLQMEKIKAVNEKEIFATITHDCYYQMQNARLALKKSWPKIRIIEASKARYLLFVKVNKKKICIDLNNKNDICGLFLFDREKDPVLADMPNIDTVLEFYFSKN